MSVTFSNHLDLELRNRVSNLPAPVGSSDAVRKQDLDSAVAGLRDKVSCRVSTQGNINLASPGAAIDGITLAANDRVLVRQQTAGSENGIYVWNGAAAAMTRALLADTAEELEQALTTIEEGTNAGTTWRQTSVNFVLGTGAVSWIPFGTSSPAASTTVAGTVTLGTQGEVDNGPNNDDVVTVTTLRSWSNRKLKATLVIGDGTATQFTLTHNFNTRDLLGTLVRNASPWDQVLADITFPTLNTAQVTFSAAPASNAFVFAVIG